MIKTLSSEATKDRDGEKGFVSNFSNFDGNTEFPTNNIPAATGIRFLKRKNFKGRLIRGTWLEKGNLPGKLTMTKESKRYMSSRVVRKPIQFLVF